MLHTIFLPAVALAALPLMASPVSAPDPSQFTPAGDEVPFVVSPDSVTRAMLDIARVGPRDALIDLGSGDGRIVIAAARRGAQALGVEIDPALVARSERNARAAGLSARARFVKQDLFETDLAGASVITMYLLQEVNLQLRPRLLALAPGTRIVSHDWHLGDWQPDRRLTIDVPDKPVGREKTSQVMLWIVPARVAGLWCAESEGRRATLRLDQSYQRVSGELRLDGGLARAVLGEVDGVSLVLSASTPGSLQLRLTEAVLRAGEATGAFAGLAAMRWRRGDGACGPT